MISEAEIGLAGAITRASHARRAAAVGNENAITRFMGLDVRLDEIASAADVRCNFGGQVPHPSMEDVALTSPMEPVSIGQLCDTGPSSLAPTIRRFKVGSQARTGE